MSKKAIRRSPTDGDHKQRIKEDFGKRLFRALTAKEMTQSDLARAIKVPRMAISLYVNGKSLPGRARLQKIAEVLGVDKQDLLPSLTDDIYVAADPTLEVRILAENPNRAFLRVNKTVPTPLALEIAGKLSKNETDK